MCFWGSLCSLKTHTTRKIRVTKSLLFLPRTDRDSACLSSTVCDKLHTPRDGIPAKRWGYWNAQWFKFPFSSTAKWDIPWDMMRGKSSDIADHRLTNLTFTSAQYLRSRDPLKDDYQEISCLLCVLCVYWYEYGSHVTSLYSHVSHVRVWHAVPIHGK